MAGARKRSAPAAVVEAARDEPAPKRRSSRQAAAALAAAPTKPVDAPSRQQKKKSDELQTEGREGGSSRQAARRGAGAKSKRHNDVPAAKTTDVLPSDDGATDVEAIPAVNPEAPRHDGEWYWLMKAEPETRLENGVDVSFSIDDLRSKTSPEGWDGIRAYAARNHMRSMNVGDKAFFYHSNCKEPGIAGIMEIVKEFSPDSSALVPGAPYHDLASTKENPRWSLVHVEFRRKFAVPIPLRELRELGKPGGALEGMQMLRQSRLSVSRVSSTEWAALCRLADKKAAEAGLEHQDGRQLGG